MTAFTRRNLLRGAGVAALLGGSWAVYQSMRTPRTDAEDILARHFGRDLVETEPARAFISDYTTLRGWPQTPLRSPPQIAAMEAPLLTSFLQSTNALMQLRRGDAFIYLGLFDPFTTPCLSQLNVPLDA